MADLDIFHGNHVHCPRRDCDAVPHFTGSLFHRPEDMSGYCLSLSFRCESGHEWVINFEDHSGAIWISQTRIGKG